MLPREGNPQPAEGEYTLRVVAVELHTSASARSDSVYSGRPAEPDRLRIKSAVLNGPSGGTATQHIVHSYNVARSLTRNFVDEWLHAIGAPELRCEPREYDWAACIDKEYELRVVHREVYYCVTDVRPVGQQPKSLTQR